LKIFISGGTGFIGQAIAKALLRQGHAVRVLSRGAKKAKDLFLNQSVEIVEGNLQDPQTFAKALEGMEVVIQCAQFPGHPVENPKKGYTYWQVDALGTGNLAKAAKLAGVKHFIYLSGAGTDGKRSEPWFKAKWYAEQAVRGSGITATILRPSWVYGPGDKSLNRMIQMLRKLPLFALIGSGKNHVQPIFVDDLAEVIAACVSTTPQEDQIFEIGGPEEMTMKEMLQRTAKFLGKKRIFIPIPKILVKFGAFFLQFLPNPPLNPKAVDFITMDVHLNAESFKKTFPNIHLKTLEEGLRSY